MHIDPHVQSYIEKHLLAPQSICRFSDGSIGYILGDGTISTCRRARYRNCASALSRIARLATGWRRRVEVADAVAPVVELTPCPPTAAHDRWRGLHEAATEPASAAPPSPLPLNQTRTRCRT